MSSLTSRCMMQISVHMKTFHFHIYVEMKYSQLCHESVYTEQGSETCQWRYQFISLFLLKVYRITVEKWTEKMMGKKCFILFSL